MLDQEMFYMIHNVEKALGINLYDDQIRYLTGSTASFNFYNNRGTGKTTAYCIRLALSDGEPLNLRDPKEFSDWFESGLSFNEAPRYSKDFFLKEFMKIRDKLKDHGFQVREVLMLSKNREG